MQNDILDLIREKRDGMSKGHRLVADYLLEHFESAAYMTAQTLGTAAGVSESTVVRFAAELGLDGYPMLQQKVQDASRHRLTSVQRIKLSEMRLGDDIPGNVLTSDMEKIRYTMENLSRDSFNRAIDAIDNAGNIYITGVRSSAALAQFLYYYLDTIYDNVKFIRSSGGSEIFEQLMKIKENDVMFIFSNSGRNTVSVDMAMCAKEKGMKTVCITNMNHTKSVTSRHPSGKLMYEVCDIVIDNCGCIGDAAIDIGGKMVGPTSTVIGAMVMQAIVCGAVEMLQQRGVEPEVFLSGNIDAGDAANEKYIKKYSGQIRIL